MKFPHYAVLLLLVIRYIKAYITLKHQTDAENTIYFENTKILTKCLFTSVTL